MRIKLEVGTYFRMIEGRENRWILTKLMFGGGMIIVRGNIYN